MNFYHRFVAHFLVQFLFPWKLAFLLPASKIQIPLIQSKMYIFMMLNKWHRNQFLKSRLHRVFKRLNTPKWESLVLSELNRSLFENEKKLTHQRGEALRIARSPSDILGKWPFFTCITVWAETFQYKLKETYIFHKILIRNNDNNVWYC